MITLILCIVILIVCLQTRVDHDEIKDKLDKILKQLGVEKMEKNEYNSACISKEMFCKECGWPIIDACCNDEFQNFKDASEWDWWYYCSNKGCKNHDGEGVFQNRPDWIGRRNGNSK